MQETPEAVSSACALQNACTVTVNSALHTRLQAEYNRRIQGSSGLKLLFWKQFTSAPSVTALFPVGQVPCALGAHCFSLGQGRTVGAELLSYSSFAGAGALQQ